MYKRQVNALVKAEEDWVPSEPETSLYIRPFAFACESSLGVHKSKAYKFVIILSPVGAYYAEGLAPVKIMVEDEYVRAVQGGTEMCIRDRLYTGAGRDGKDSYRCPGGDGRRLGAVPVSAKRSWLQVSPAVE